jgi:predicted GNAT superfamily acetyltransferase
MAGQPVNNSTQSHPVVDKSHPAPNTPCDDERMAISPENANAQLPAGIALRRPTEHDHAAVAGVIVDWWNLPGTAHLPTLLPRLFFQHFTDTSFIAEDSKGLAGFLIGFRSASQPHVAYIHFVGVRPDVRNAGLARALYETFFAESRAAGCHRVNAITGVGNRRSQAFHAAMGFEPTGDTEIDGVLGWRDYDGPGEHRVAFTRAI